MILIMFIFSLKLYMKKMEEIKNDFFNFYFLNTDFSITIWN